MHFHYSSVIWMPCNSRSLENVHKIGTQTHSQTSIRPPQHACFFFFTFVIFLIIWLILLTNNVVLLRSIHIAPTDGNRHFIRFCRISVIPVRVCCRLSELVFVYWTCWIRIRIEKWCGVICWLLALVCFCWRSVNWSLVVSHILPWINPFPFKIYTLTAKQVSWFWCKLLVYVNSKV